MRRLYLTGAFGGAMLFWPFELPWMRELGITNRQIILLFGAASLSQLLFEIPTGVLADRFGRKRSLLVGELVFFAAVASLPHCRGFSSLCVVHVLYGLGGALASGADVALHYDTLAERGRSELFATSQALLNNCERLSIIVMFAIAGPLASIIGVQRLFYVSLLLVAIRVFFTIRLTEPRAISVAADQKGGGLDLSGLKARALIIVILINALLFSSYLVADEFLTVVLHDIDFPIVLFGMWGIFQAIAGSIEPYIVTALGRLNRSLAVACLTAVAALAFGAALVMPAVWAPALIAAGTLATEFTFPLITDMVNRAVDSSVRATASSVTSAFAYVASIPLGLAFAGISELTSTAIAISITSMVLSALVITIFVATWRLHSRT